MAQSMGIGVLGSPSTCFIRKFRFTLSIDGVAGMDDANILPPSKAARPSLSFKEMEAQHLNETVYFPGKPEWKPLNVTLYGIKKNPNPVIEWVSNMYDVVDEKYNYPVDSNFILQHDIVISMLSGCGDLIETWTYEDPWLQNADFGDLDMSVSELANIDLTIRYSRAYVQTF